MYTCEALEMEELRIEGNAAGTPETMGIWGPTSEKSLNQADGSSVRCRDLIEEMPETTTNLLDRILAEHCVASIGTHSETLSLIMSEVPDGASKLFRTAV